MKQMAEMKPMVNIHEVGIEAGRVMNILLVVYRIAQVIQVTGKILENEVEITAWALISFLVVNDECRDFLMMKVDEYRDFPIEMMNHCRDFLIENDDCRGFVIFLKFQKVEFLELLVEVKMKEVV